MPKQLSDTLSGQKYCSTVCLAGWTATDAPKCLRSEPGIACLRIDTDRPTVQVFARAGLYTVCGASREASGLGRHRGWWSARLQFMKRGDGDGDGQSALGGFFAVLNGVDEHLDGLSGVGRNEDGRGQEPGAHPGLAGLGQAVAAGERQFQPALAFRLVRQFFKGFPSSKGHRIILCANQVNGGPL